MRHSTIPLRPKSESARLQPPVLPTRKVFNCIVDDTALIAGVKKSTRDGIRKWVSNGSIRIFVPLHTLNHLSHLKKGSERVNSDAREALKWLDEITSVTSVQSAGLVQLEGVDEAFHTWEEVEAFLLPETLLSMEDSDSDEESLIEDLDSSINPYEGSDRTSMSSSLSTEDRPKTPLSPRSTYSSNSPKAVSSSPAKKNGSIESMDSPNRTARNSIELGCKDKGSQSTVPVYYQSLFNHILWRIHQEQNADAALESFILLTNDPAKQNIAQRFGIRAKRLEQLRDTVAREDRDYKNRLVLYKKEAGEVNEVADKVPRTIPDEPRPMMKNAEANSDDEDVILLKGAPRGPQASTGKNVWDPNDFGRAAQHGQTRGGRGGRRGHHGARGAYVAPMPASVPIRPAPAPKVDPNGPIDPDSYSRPPPRASTMRGGRRKLWEPT